MDGEDGVRTGQGKVRRTDQKNAGGMNESAGNPKKPIEAAGDKAVG